MNELELTDSGITLHSTQYCKICLNTLISLNSNGVSGFFIVQPVCVILDEV
jgi:hypothetical protein